ncbi:MULTISPECIES: GNAT family N-acetyltransferase [unclassified Bacteroides]|jgi:predicted acetyltransferase|uniref:GNAT family N-acetyltransferase n=1 Tax=unclassified Bacteroides TaxID=2646097 RepID=UPI000E91C92C|nr:MULTISPECIES: GNAT family N-acetyltransferase [unclassified Bacteroides]RGN51235.1 GNAT family N-acetyltransferase [Bacteroides sp. OM05-12]RHR78651.1 GNAT family N-acetyltransferase [Bacteroides sp. AF16-49]
MEQKESQREVTKALWKLCFQDNEAFTDLYFRMRYKDEINMAIYENNQMVSALQMIPYPMTFCNEIISTSYISGACTHPHYRNHGAMGQLLADTFIRMYDNGILLSTLIPAEEWLFSYYGRYGYTPAFDYSIEKIDTTELMPSSQYEIAEYTPYQLDVHAYLMRKLMERPCCIQHTMDDFEVILEDLKLSGGKLLIARKQMEIVGMAFCILEESAIHIPELLYEDTEIRNSLLKEASRQMSTSFVEYIKPAKGESDQKLGMARIINVEQMLQLYAKEHNEIHLALEISDEIINENQGYYLLKYGVCERSFEPIKESIPLSIGELTRILLGYHTDLLPDPLRSFTLQKPYMSLMLN